MSAKQIDVECPCCSCLITVDVLTRKVMRHVKLEERAGGPAAATRWETAQDRVSARSKSSADKLESALESERNKTARMDELFRKAQEKHSKKSDDAD